MSEAFSMSDKPLSLLSATTRRTRSRKPSKEIGQSLVSFSPPQRLSEPPVRCIIRPRSSITRPVPAEGKIIPTGANSRQPQCTKMCWKSLKALRATDIILGGGE